MDELLQKLKCFVYSSTVVFNKLSGSVDIQNMLNTDPEFKENFVSIKKLLPQFMSFYAQTMHMDKEESDNFAKQYKKSLEILNKSLTK